MKNEIITNEKELELELAVSELELGILTTNAKTIKETVSNMLVNYKAENYSEETIEQASKDKALLNTTAKKLNDERIRIEKEFMKPFEEFKLVVKETTDMIKDASSKIDVIVKEVENKAKETRKNTIKIFFKGIVGELESIITLDKIFDDKWLNKGSFNEKGEFKKAQELEDKLNKIRTELETIKSLNSKHELALTNQYLKDFNLGQAIIENNRLNELEQKTVVVEEKKEEIKQAKIEEIITKPVDTYDEQIRTYILKITGTVEQHKKLKQFLELNHMTTENNETGKIIVD